MPCVRMSVSVRPSELEPWGKLAIDRAAELVLAAIPAEQDPEPGKTARRSLAGVGYISRAHPVPAARPARPARALALRRPGRRIAYDFRPPTPGSARG